MKNLFYLLTLIIFTLTSCDKTTDVENQQITNAVEFGGLKVNLPSNYNKSVLSLSLSELQNQFYYSKSGGPLSSRMYNHYLLAQRCGLVGGIYF